MYLRRLKDVTKKTSFLRCIWDVLKTSQKDIFLTCIWGVLKTSQKRHLVWDIFEMPLRRHKKTSFSRCMWDALKTSQKKPSFLRYIWDALKTSQKRRLFEDISYRSLRCLSQWRSDGDMSKTSHAGWGTIVRRRGRSRLWCRNSFYKYSHQKIYWFYLR